MILEFHGHGKIRGLLHIQKKGVDNPCPSLKGARRHWRSGELGYPLYPPENISKQEMRLGEFRGSGPR